MVYVSWFDFIHIEGYLEADMQICREANNYNWILLWSKINQSKFTALYVVSVSDNLTWNSKYQLPVVSHEPNLNNYSYNKLSCED